MREAFHDSLNHISDQLVEMTRLAGSAMTRATTALLDADLALAEGVIDGDARIDEGRDRLEDQAIEILARQQPVATDLRMVVTAMHMAASLERMGDLAAHVAKVARLRYPLSAVPAEMRGLIVEADQVAARLVIKAGSIIAAKDVTGAEQLNADDDQMDHLHKEVFRILAADGWSHGVETAVDITLLARYYERFADHAVSVARNVEYLVTGVWHSRRPYADVE
ncbi:MAG: phosphate signaling complex protein PhoU [Austwickia sp.]|nr:phosphate signaling complex protein PhoU [Austwickia sp.]MBK8436368.1 phosphate signaling complex protein PhoU [Austwickia sp.]MBK9102044.1 phosphate signaling complex protein PhoU [Austwickia sp.]